MLSISGFPWNTHYRESCGREVVDKLFFAVVHGHFQVYSNAEFAVWQSLDANHFRDVITVHRIVAGSVGEGDEHAHPYVISCAAGMKINTFFRGVYAGDEVFKMIVAGL